MKRLWLRATGRTVYHAIKHKVVKNESMKSHYVIAECKQRIVMHDTKSPTIYCEDGDWSSGGWKSIFPRCGRCLKTLKALRKKEEP